MTERGYWHVWLALVALLLVALFVILSYLDFHRPSVVTAGSALAVLAASYPLLAGPVARAWASLVPHLGTALGLVDRRKNAAVAWSLLAIVVSTVGTAHVLNGFIDRYRYVSIIRSTVQALGSETAKLPDPADLAFAFTLYPGRKEVPVLLVRAGRIFSHGDDWPKFISFQKAFADGISDFLADDAICAVKATHHDPVAFAALVVLEAGVVLENGRPKLDPTFIDALDRAAHLLDRCPDKPIERAIQAVRIRDQRNALEGRTGLEVDAMLQSIEADIAALAPQGAANLFRTHAFQEYLDFRAFRMIEALSGKDSLWQARTRDETIGVADEVVREYRRILSLRRAIGAAGEVLWFASPGKLNLYRLFMAEGGFRSSRNDVFVATVKSIPELHAEIAQLLAAPAFEDFREPDAWFRATPLDLELEGSRLASTFDQWMKTGW